jgi:hypothetical protein
VLIIGQSPTGNRTNIKVQFDPITNNTALILGAPETNFFPLKTVFDNSGNLYIVGNIKTPSNHDGFIIKLFNNKIIWAKKYSSKDTLNLFDIDHIDGKLIISGDIINKKTNQPSGIQLEVTTKNGEITNFNQLGISKANTFDSFNSNNGNTWITGLIEGSNKFEYNIFSSKIDLNKQAKTQNVPVIVSDLNLSSEETITTYNKEIVPLIYVPVTSIIGPIIK